MGTAVHLKLRRVARLRTLNEHFISGNPGCRQHAESTRRIMNILAGSSWSEKPVFQLCMFPCSQMTHYGTVQLWHTAPLILVAHLQSRPTHILIGHLPVGSLPVGHDFPHDDAVAPRVTGGGELPVGDGLRCGPPNRDLTALDTQTHTYKLQHRSGVLHLVYIITILHGSQLNVITTR